MTDNILARCAPAGTATAAPVRSHHGWALVVLLVGAILPPLDYFIVNLALPAIRDGIGARPAELELVVSAYACANAVVQITGGRLGDLYGTCETGAVRARPLVGIGIGIGITSLLMFLFRMPRLPFGQLDAVARQRFVVQVENARRAAAVAAVFQFGLYGRGRTRIVCGRFGSGRSGRLGHGEIRMKGRVQYTWMARHIPTIVT